VGTKQIWERGLAETAAFLVLSPRGWRDGLAEDREETNKEEEGPTAEGLMIVIQLIRSVLQAAVSTRDRSVLCVESCGCRERQQQRPRAPSGQADRVFRDTVGS